MSTFPGYAGSSNADTSNSQRPLEDFMVLNREDFDLAGQRLLFWQLQMFNR